MNSASSGNPQSNNLYAYVRNMPTDFVDPSGLNMAPGMCYTYGYGKEYTFSDGTVIRITQGTFTICSGGGGGYSHTGGTTRGGGSGGGSSLGTSAVSSNASRKFNNCVTAEKAKCYASGYKVFVDNLPGDVFWHAVGIPGAMNTLYGLVMGVSLWSVKRILGWMGLVAGAALGVRSAAQKGKREEESCEKKIEETCKQQLP